MGWVGQPPETRVRQANPTFESEGNNFSLLAKSSILPTLNSSAQLEAILFEIGHCEFFVQLALRQEIWY